MRKLKHMSCELHLDAIESVGMTAHETVRKLESDLRLTLYILFLKASIIGNFGVL